VDVVIFQIDSRKRCCVAMSSVEEVISLGPVTPVPSAPPAVIGAVNVRGQICPVLRLEALLREVYPRPTLQEPNASRPLGPLDPLRQGQPCLLVQAGGCQAVLCVRRIEEVARIRDSLLSSGGGDMLVGAVFDTADGPLHLVDVEQVMRRVTRQVQELATQLGAGPSI